MSLVRSKKTMTSGLTSSILDRNSTDAVGVANSQGVKIINNVMHNQDDCVVSRVRRGRA